MDKFLKEYQGKTIRDDGAYMSEAAKSFFRKSLLSGCLHICLRTFK